MSHRYAQRDFARAVLADVATGDMNADFGSAENAVVAANLGPMAVWIAGKVHDHLLACAGEATKWVESSACNAPSPATSGLSEDSD